MIDMEIVKEEYKSVVRKEWHYEAFECEWFKCRAIRVDRLWHWCWYVWIPNTHRLYNVCDDWVYDEDKTKYDKKYLKDQELISSLSMHWWLTYTSDSLCMQPEKDLWWFWFDTAHCWDLPITDRWYEMDWDVYRDKEYVINEIKKLAKQLKQIK